MASNPNLYVKKISLLEDKKMKKHVIQIFLVLLFLSTTFLFPLQVTAQYINVTPSEWDFGDVEVGALVSKVFIITDAGLTTLTVYEVTLEDDTTSSFEFAGDVPPPQFWIHWIFGNFLPKNLEVEVVFSPTSIGPCTAKLHISSDAIEPHTNELDIPLQGNGVVAGTSPRAQIVETLEFFNRSISDGNLVGSGPGKSAENRLNALNNMLLSVQDFIESGDYKGACKQILDAVMKCDGDEIPPDFVTGDAAPEFLERLQDLQAELGCI